MNAISGWRLAICVAGLVTATEAASYPECEPNPTGAAVFIATRIANVEELDKVYDYYLVRALQKQMPRASFIDLSRSVNSQLGQGSAPAGQKVRAILKRPVIQEIDQPAVRKFTGLSGAAVGASFGVVSSQSAAASELFLSLQCADGEWKVTSISVRSTDR